VGLNIEEFTNTITNIANIAERKQLTEEDIKKIINDKLKSFEEELDKVKEKIDKIKNEVKGQLAGVEISSATISRVVCSTKTSLLRAGYRRLKLG